MEKNRKIIVAVTGASGAVYAKLLFEELLRIKDTPAEVGVIFSVNGREIWNYELGEPFCPVFPFRIFEITDFYAPFASGSSSYDTLIICPCSMGTLGRIAAGISDDLITRAADVMLKERRRLILVPREAPYNLVHIDNMRKITLAGGIICPANPSFYLRPKTLENAIMTIVSRILDLAGFNNKPFRWGE